MLNNATTTAASSATAAPTVSALRAVAPEAKSLAPRPVAPVHIKRWTGRAALTLPLPSLADRWLSPATRA
jgi:hypothetical protein